MLRRTPLNNSRGVTELIERYNPVVFKRFCGALGFTSAALLGCGFPVAGGIMSVFTAGFVYQGILDMRQSKHTLLRNFPVLAHARYVLEGIRPEIRQYFIEGDHERLPFSRSDRSVVYARSKGEAGTQPFGTREDVYAPGYEYVLHSMFPKPKIKLADARVMIGEGQCAKPYSAAIFNSSAMSFGALSKNAVLAIGKGAKIGGFYQNTGEGGVTPYHLENGNDIVMNMGTAYFGVRTPDGKFDEDKFVALIKRAPQIKMIEIKLSQGAKPSKGGMLAKEKITAEIAEIRGIPRDRDCVSPASHSSFDSPHTLIKFAAKLRKLSGGLPVGIKMCVGDPVELASIVRASRDMKSYLDFITVDGSEGGTGAAPLEHQNYVGVPGLSGLYLVHNMLRGAGIRDKTKVIMAGKITNGMHLFRYLHMGADICNAARAMMFALGCVQALQCDTDLCPTGVTSHNPLRQQGLVPETKAVRIANFQAATVSSCLDLVAACGFSELSDIRKRPVLMMRTSSTDAHFSSELFPKLKDGELNEVESENRPKERLTAAIQNMTVKDRLVRAWIISGDPSLQPRIKLYMRSVKTEDQEACDRELAKEEKLRHEKIAQHVLLNKWDGDLGPDEAGKKYQSVKQ